MDLDTTLLFGLLVAITLTIAVLALRHDRERHEQRLVREAIVGYFQKSGLFVTANCFRTAEGLVALVESEPDRQFRFSYLRERALADHVVKTTGKRIESVYWRFRLRKGTTLPKEYREYDTPARSDLFPSANDLARAMAQDLEGLAKDDDNREKDFEKAPRTNAKPAGAETLSNLLGRRK